MMAWTDEASKAARFLCSTPSYGNTTLRMADLQSLLFESGGQLLACGSLYNIKSKHLGADVFKVTLEIANP